MLEAAGQGERERSQLAQVLGPSEPMMGERRALAQGPAKALLDRPLKTQEIYDAITKGGVRLGSSGTLYRSLTRDDDFHKVGRGRWGLTEWYPNAKRGARDPDTDADESTPEPESSETNPPNGDTAAQTAQEGSGAETRGSDG